VPVEPRAMGSKKWRYYRRYHAGGLELIRNEIEITQVENWIKSEDSTEHLAELANKQHTNDFSDFEYIALRYVCRNDGIFLFQIKTYREMLSYTPMRIAREVSYRIKELLGHTHVYNKDEFSGLYKTIVTNPVFIEERSNKIPEIHYEFEKYIRHNEHLLNLKSRKRNLSEPIDDDAERAVLTLKKLYSRIFDRSCLVLNNYEKVSEGIFSNTNRRIIPVQILGLALIFYFIFFLTLLHVISFDSQNIKTAAPQILFFHVVIILAFSYYYHFKRNIRDEALSKIVILKRTIAYFSHGNNYSRIIWTLFDGSRVISPENDYNGVIRVSQQQIDANVRKINYYYFLYGFSVAFTGLIFSTYSFLLKGV